MKVEIAGPVGRAKSGVSKEPGGRLAAALSVHARTGVRTPLRGAETTGASPLALPRPDLSDTRYKPFLSKVLRRE